MNFFIVYELDKRLPDSNSGFTWSDRLFGGVKSGKNSHPDKYL